MPVKLGEVSILTSPVSLVRIWALLSGCLTFSLAASVEHPSQLQAFKASCMGSWCLLFVLTLLITLVEFIQFQSLVPISWKNLPVTVSALGALVYLSTSVGFPWLLVDRGPDARAIAATIASCLTFLAYASETHLLRKRSPEQRGYMASAPGLLKVFQVFGGGAMLLLVSDQCRDGRHGGWQLWLSLAMYILCFLMSLGTVAVMICDCASRCPLPFGRLLVVFSHLGVLLYMVVTVICFTNVMSVQGTDDSDMVKTVTGSVVTCLTLLAYTVDLAFSIKLLCDRA
ncbi:hypothetical protein AAFF_G00407560 [Aldrovandia affinis]|uniref:MARVEL domain-containing protein n=1 Tax=Aldrovandia affinis TaxID=143900 RepID=A0AAD7SDY1_9TELE|nr:hypothetical protein AAFF_G00407560 [Aldrovandia affinis]